MIVRDLPYLIGLLWDVSGQNVHVRSVLTDEKSLSKNSSGFSESSNRCGSR